MLRRDKGLTELVFLIGLLLLPLDGKFWGAGLPALFIASALTYSIAWELPRLLFQKRVGAADQFSASVAITFVLLCFYLGKTDKAIAQIAKEQGQGVAFNSPLWLVGDGVLLALTIAVMMVLLALTTIMLQIGGKEGKSWWQSSLEAFGLGGIGGLIGTVIGLGGGAWAVAVSTNGFGLGAASWVAMWAAVRFCNWFSSEGKTMQSLVGSAVVAGLLGGVIGWVLGSLKTAMIASLIGGMVAIAHYGVLLLLPEPMQPRPKDAPFYVPWVGFYTMRFSGLLVAFFAVGAGWLWGLR